jgi:hypothetical protein
MRDYKKLSIKWLAIAVAAVSVGYGVRTATILSNDVHLRYVASPGPLRVTLYDADGARLRRTDFEGQVFQHTVVLPRGHFEAELSRGMGPKTRHAFEVVADGQAIEITYQPKQAPAEAPNTPEGR